MSAITITWKPGDPLSKNTNGTENEIDEGACKDVLWLAMPGLEMTQMGPSKWKAFFPGQKTEFAECMIKFAKREWYHMEVIEGDN
ncbi:hypothetical protein HBI81_240740 [Parastagonospora nodorum]|nr:hypothetical protein HBI06_258100 [Parastagonospora nodorum]KAH5988984.1 hypothetical protein HBI83_259470 [Parastagonospora nodorum]KAH6100078.1 hypothetical protein HBI64_255750 [Parastagonospora nodorum]KAH6383341.1 hypothetical protein HBI60_257550 [Parastagonospora nodorum]KAH6480163.1 hypothetical protein HBI55_255310 [Parastagonospora nodorum]